MASRFGDYRKDDPTSFNLQPQLEYLPQFMFNLRRSQFVQVRVQCQWLGAYRRFCCHCLPLQSRVIAKQHIKSWMHAWLSCVYPMALHPDLHLLRLECCSAPGGLHKSSRLAVPIMFGSCSVAALPVVLLPKRSAEGWHLFKSRQDSGDTADAVSTISACPASLQHILAVTACFFLHG